MGGAERSDALQRGADRSIAVLQRSLGGEIKERGGRLWAAKAPGQQDSWTWTSDPT